ncbi:MAG: phospho-N-acetylmuramoyl-pentapeptide-transferase [candidate division WOR-3 bacterium]
MLYQLLYHMHDRIGLLSLFRYITLRAALCGGFCLLVCLVFGPLVIRWARRLAFGQQIREEVPARHQAKAGTPTMGGLLIVGAIVAGILLFADLANTYVLFALSTLIWLGLLGFADDYVKVRLKRPRGLNKRVKLAAQIALGLAVGTIVCLRSSESAELTRTNFLFLKNLQIDFRSPLVYVPFVALVIVACSNAVNLADGLDGLACGLLGIAASAYAAFAYIAGNVKFARYLDVIWVPGSGELTIVCLGLMGAVLGFLWFNAHPATIFMGDSGSLPLGGLLGMVAVLVKQELLLLVVGGVFVVETVSVLLQVAGFHLLRGRRVFRMAPIHHHFELLGWSEEKIVTRFWILGILFALVAVATLKIR